VDKIAPDSERISCEELMAFLQSFPEVASCFEGCEKKHREAIKTIVCAKKKLKNAINNLEVLK